MSLSSEPLKCIMTRFVLFKFFILKCVLPSLDVHWPSLYFLFFTSDETFEARLTMELDSLS